MGQSVLSGALCSLYHFRSNCQFDLKDARPPRSPHSAIEG